MNKEMAFFRMASSEAVGHSQGDAVTAASVSVADEICDHRRIIELVADSEAEAPPGVATDQQTRTRRDRGPDVGLPHGVAVLIAERGEPNAEPRDDLCVDLDSGRDSGRAEWDLAAHG